ncbi:CDP-glycerol glycerophosphotransferase family protein [Pseudogracilibacillus sp. SE30717A]|uniref:CDP-glycerol glycerophosphotransferase family protein n=1 Tax=Pseudogracilibacillus sp. SE30717A TaxID=3098293 RepID=UPI00300E5464
MGRELAISIYLTIFRILFSFFNRFSLKEKTTFVASFGGNINVTLDELEQQVPNQEIVVMKTANCNTKFSTNGGIILQFENKLLDFIKSVYHLATSTHIIIDNYYGFLAATNFKPEVKCIQLWHAAGAIKQFGLEDLTNGSRSERALQRFQKVYNTFDHIVVGSDEMVQIFKNSFGLPEERFMRTGIPRTDFFFDDIQRKKAENKLIKDFPIIKTKKVILYAPTYRDDELNDAKLAIDLDKMYEQFKYEYVLFLRLHPSVNSEFKNKYPGFIYNVSSYSNINDLLLGTDILITDYSSIPFEFSLLHKPMIFYAYDLEEYAQKRGIWTDYIARVPGPVVETTQELIQVIKDQDFDLDKVQEFTKEWNRYSVGNSSEKLIMALYDLVPSEQEERIREHV